MNSPFLLFVLIVAIMVSYYVKYLNRDKPFTFQQPFLVLKDFTISSSEFNANSYHVTVDFHGHKLTFDYFFGRTSITLNVNGPYDRPSSNQLTIEEIINLLTANRLPFTLKGKIKVRPTGQKVFYEQSGHENDPKYLQSVLKLLLEIAGCYPAIVNWGGSLIPLLYPLTNSIENGQLQPVTTQLIRDIADMTVRQWGHQHTSLICPDCLTRCTAHKVRPLLWEPVTYYGCRKCYQSKDFLAAEKIIAILDDQMTVAYARQGDQLRVNWLNHRKLFDFEEVDIVRAADEEIERFALQVGNDTDKSYRDRYEKMVCKLSPHCTLSTNTIRILQSTFGQVTMSSF